MPILINTLILGIALVLPLHADQSGAHYHITGENALTVYSDSSIDISDILKEEDWSPLPDDRIRRGEGVLWLKISLEDIAEQKFYITEHKGLRAWEYYLVGKGSVQSQGEVDWGRPHGHDSPDMVPYRTFAYTPVSGSTSGGVLYLKLIPEYSRTFHFTIRSESSFFLAFHNWSFVQGVGLGIFLMQLLLAFLLAIRLRYRVSSYFLVLTLFSGFNVLFVSGLGPFIHSLLVPELSYIIWYVLISLFIPVTILYIQSFLGLEKRGGKIQLYFRILFFISFFFVLLTPLFPLQSLFLALNLYSLSAYAVLIGGLFYLYRRGSGSSGWLFSGWVVYLVLTTTGYTLSALNSSLGLLASLSFYLGQGLLILFYGGALILDIEEKRQRAVRKRREIEFTNRAVLERLTENEKMAELGRLVSSVTHELGTPLGVGVTLSTTINNRAVQLMKEYKEGDLSELDFREFVIDVQESSDLVYRNMLLARDLMAGFKDVAADQAAPDIREIRLREYTDKIIKVLRPGFKNYPSIIESSIDKSLKIVSIPGILTQVLINLINNAVIHGLEDRPDAAVFLEAERSENGVTLTVRDTGKGIPPDIQERIFDIYFTTKKGKGGTGVGLPIVHSLVEETLKGTLSFKSREGEGTEFNISLPMDLSKI